MFAILQKRQFYKGTFGAETRWKITSSGYATRAEARRYVKSLDGRVYFLSHGECGRPEYQIVKMCGRRYKAALDRENGWILGVDVDPQFGDAETPEGNNHRAYAGMNMPGAGYDG